MFHQHTERTTRKDQQNAKIVHYNKKIGPAGQKKDNLLLIPFSTKFFVLMTLSCISWTKFLLQNLKNFLNKKHNKFH